MQIQGQKLWCMYNNSTNMFSTNIASVTQTTVFRSAGASTVQLK